MTVACLLANIAFGQSTFRDHFSNIEVTLDTNQYNFNDDKIQVQDIWKLPFQFKEESPEALFKLYPVKDSVIDKIYQLLPSRDYTIID